MSLTTYMTGGLALALAVCVFFWRMDAKRHSDVVAAHVAFEAVATKQLKDAETVTDENFNTVSKLLKDIERQKELTAKAERAAHQRDATLKQALKRIQDAPLSDDGDIAPVLARELRGLRTDDVADRPGPADGADQGAAGHPDDTAQPDVPAAPPAS